MRGVTICVAHLLCGHNELSNKFHNTRIATILFLHRLAVRRKVLRLKRLAHEIFGLQLPRRLCLLKGFLLNFFFEPSGHEAGSRGCATLGCAAASTFKTLRFELYGFLGDG